MNEKHETLEKTLAKEEDKPGGSLMAALSPYEIPANTPGELHWIYSLWVSYGGHLIFLGMEFLEFPAGNGENAKPAVRSGGALPPPRMTPEMGLVHPGAYCHRGFDSWPEMFFWAETHRVVYHDPSRSKVW